MEPQEDTLDNLEPQELTLDNQEDTLDNLEPQELILVNQEDTLVNLEDTLDNPELILDNNHTLDKESKAKRTTKKEKTRKIRIRIRVAKMLPKLLKKPKKPKRMLPGKHFSTKSTKIAVVNLMNVNSVISGCILAKMVME